MFPFFSDSTSHTGTVAVSLNNQYGNMNSSNPVPSVQQNSSLPVATTTSVSFVTNDDDNKAPFSETLYAVEVSSRGKTWHVKRNIEDFRLLDQQCHQCVYDRKYSQLSEIPMEENVDPHLPTTQYHATNSKVGHVRHLNIYSLLVNQTSDYR